MNEPYFLIKHKSGGLFVHPKGGKKNPGNTTGLLLHPDRHDNMRFQFEIKENHWGYIRHASSGKIFHPKGGEMKPKNDNNLVLHSDQHAGALFALDCVNGHIIHKGGRFVRPEGKRPNPVKNTYLVLSEDIDDAMKFEFVSPDDIYKEVLVYGKPTIVGEWRLLNAIISPRGAHESTFYVSYGKSKTKSKTTSIAFRWEISVGFPAKSFESTAEIAYKVENASSQTWTEEKTVSHTITVPPGKTVVTWQFIFAAHQYGHHGEFSSNITADTDSLDIKPDEKYMI